MTLYCNSVVKRVSAFRAECVIINGNDEYTIVVAALCDIK